MSAPMDEPTAKPSLMPEPLVVSKQAEEFKAQLISNNGKKPEGSGGSSFYTWFMVLALLGVWTSVAVVYFDLVDYQDAIGKLSSYDADGDGDFDVEDAKVLLDGKPEHVAKRQAKKENRLTKDVGWKLKEALKQQLAMIRERVEAKKIAKMALAEVRNILAEEEVHTLKRDDTANKAKVAVAARYKAEEEKIDEEQEKVMEMIRRGKEKRKREDEEEGKKAMEKKLGKKAEGAAKMRATKEARSKDLSKAADKKLKGSDKGGRK